MPDDRPEPPAIQWGRPLRKKHRGPVAAPPPSGPPEVGPVPVEVPLASPEDGVERIDESDALGAGVSEPPAVPSPTAAPAAPRAMREPGPDDVRERDLAVFMARGLVDHPDDVSAEILSTGPDACYELHVHRDDLGHVIGKQGRTARSLRLALGAAAARLGRRADLEIAD